GARRRSEDLAVSFFVASVLQYVILTDDCLYDCLELLMPDSLVELVDSRNHLLQELSQLGDFQPGSISSVTRRCGKPNCHCAQPNHPGHGPHRQLTQKIAGKTVTQALSSASAVRKAEKEIAEFRRFQALAQELIEVNQKICRLRPLAAAEVFPVKKKRRKHSTRKSAEN
ncbi:MAG: DUF6788 family protein, partial [Candidatus Sulfotelmatobacter sp.]